ncbi:MAG: energy transducer TonB [Calditrichaeota bacterium]|nr:energy transducer TonB [Calditrichota bacterium]
MYFIQKETFQKHLLKISILISLLIHFLFLLLYRPISQWQLFPIAELLKQDKPNEVEKRIEFELVETPEDARSETPPENTNLVSDKNSRARNQQQRADLPVGAPYARGDMNVHELPTFASMARPASPANQSAQQQNEAEKQQQADLKDGFTFEKFSRQQLIKRDARKQFSMAQTQSANRPTYNNQKFRAEDLGGLTFNTYAWNFAPYMLGMKRKVERNIFPPPAFTRMGLISGETILRFKVLPGGEVKDVEVLQYKGHKSLKETSVQAILNSSPFKPLPADFPENYLEVTAKFSYYIQRK